MATPSVPATVTDYYLHIQSLTPADQTIAALQTQTPTQSFPFQIPAMSIVIFLAVIILGSFGLLLTKSREINKMLLLIVFAFATSMIPLGVNSINQQTNFQSLASPINTPKNVRVSQVTQSSFTLQWETDAAQPSIVRFNLQPTFDALTQIISADQDNPTITHTLVIKNLPPKTTHYLQILSGSAWYQDNYGPLQITTK